MKDKVQHLESGDNSKNFQAETINIHGITLHEAKELAEDVFRNNITKFADEAMVTATERASHLLEKLFQELKGKDPKLLNAVREPAMQNALYEAQKAYAISGDDDVAGMLVDILTARIENDTRDLRQIVLDESIEVVSKITARQFDVLTVVFLLRHSMNRGVKTLETLKEYLERHIRPFISASESTNADFQHLEYCNCGSMNTLVGGTLEGRLNAEYKGLFSKGIEVTEFNEKWGDTSAYGTLLIPCLHDKSRLQVNALNDNVLDQQIVKLGFTNDLAANIKKCFNKTKMSEPEVVQFLAAQNNWLPPLSEHWKNSSMKGFALTTVGIALAQANYRRKTGVATDLSIWVN